MDRAIGLDDGSYKGKELDYLGVGTLTLDSTGYLHYIKVWSSNEPPKEGSFHEEVDAIGNTPYVTITNPTKVGYELADWNTYSSSSTWRYRGRWRTDFVGGTRYLFNVGAYSTGWNGYHRGSYANYDEFIKVNPSITIEAIWEPISYTIVYDGNGATGGATESSTHTYNTAKNLTENGYTKAGYGFLGWNTEPDGSGRSFKNKQSVENLSEIQGDTITLYAQWGNINYTIDYHGNGNTGGATASSSHQSGVSDKLTANGFTKTGYTFRHWKDADGNTYSNQQTVVDLTNIDISISIKKYNQKDCKS